MVRRLLLIVALLACGLVAAAVRADTFNLVNGETVTGEVLVPSANDAGAQIKVGDGEYKRVSWANFSQEDLKKFARIPKLEPFVDPFIVISPEEKIKKTEVALKQPPRLERPHAISLFGAMLGSGPGFLMLLVLSVPSPLGWSAAFPQCCRWPDRSSSCPCAPRCLSSSRRGSPSPRRPRRPRRNPGLLPSRMDLTRCRLRE
jgi:hypothetical protein